MARLRSSCAFSVWFLSQRFHFYLARLSAASAGSRQAKFPALTRNLCSPRNATSVEEQRSPRRHFVEWAAWKPPLLESRSSLTRKRQCRSVPGWQRKILPTRRSSRSNMAIKFSYEDEQFSGRSGHRIFDLRFECV